MDENRIEGTARDVGGKLQDAAGGLTGDAPTQARGKAKQVAGQVQDAYGQVADQAQDAYGRVADQAQDAYGKAAEQVRRLPREQPLAVVLSSLSLGLLFGYLLGRR